MGTPTHLSAIFPRQARLSLRQEGRTRVAALVEGGIGHTAGTATLMLLISVSLESQITESQEREGRLFGSLPSVVNVETEAVLQIAVACRQRSPALAVIDAHRDTTQFRRTNGQGGGEEKMLDKQNRFHLAAATVREAVLVLLGEFCEKSTHPALVGMIVAVGDVYVAAASIFAGHR